MTRGAARRKAFKLGGRVVPAGLAGRAAVGGVHADERRRARRRHAAGRARQPADGAQRAALRAHKAGAPGAAAPGGRQGRGPPARPPRPPARPGRHPAGRGVVVGAPGPGGGGARGRRSPRRVRRPARRPLPGRGAGARPGGAVRIVAGAVPAPEWRAVRSAWLAPHRAAVLELLRAVAGAWRSTPPSWRARRDGAGDPARLAQRAAHSAGRRWTPSTRSQPSTSGPSWPRGPRGRPAPPVRRAPPAPHRGGPS